MKKFRRYLSNYPFHYNNSDEDLSLWRPQDVALYFHIPFCVQKCGFCSYKAFAPRSDKYYREYVNVLKRELELVAGSKYIPPLRARSIYVGGGTPSLINPGLVTELLEYASGIIEFSPDIEITIECSPDTVAEEKMRHYFENGVNRLSFGVQTFDGGLARIIGRRHDAAAVVSAFESAKRAGFFEINLDLMFGFPEQTIRVWENTLDELIALKPSNVTTYNLEVWPGTLYYQKISRNPHILPGEDLENEMYFLAQRKLIDAGYEQVAVAGFIDRNQVDKYARYLDYYWLGYGHIGIGPSSDSYINETVLFNEADRDRYCEIVNAGRLPVSSYRVLTKEEQMRRLIIRGLKLMKISKHLFYERFGVYPRQVFGGIIDDLIDQGLLYEDARWVGLTRMGLVYYSNVYRAFFAYGDEANDKEGMVLRGITPDLVTV